MVYELEFHLSYVGTEATQKGRFDSDSESAYFPRISSIPSTAMGNGDGDGAPTPPVTSIAVSPAAGMVAPPPSEEGKVFGGGLFTKIPEILAKEIAK